MWCAGSSAVAVGRGQGGAPRVAAGDAAVYGFLSSCSGGLGVTQFEAWDSLFLCSCSQASLELW